MASGNDLAEYTYRFDAAKWVPKFILADKNGYALAMAIQAGVRRMNEIVNDGVALITDVDTMPEWRLDELAWELNCYYDYAETDINAKRWWIKNALPIAQIAGTPGAIITYLSRKFDRVWISEYSPYDSSAGEFPHLPTDPYHFTVVVDGEYSTGLDIAGVVSKVQNVRSVCDGVIVGTYDDMGLLMDDYQVLGSEGDVPPPIEGGNEPVNS